MKKASGPKPRRKRSVKDLAEGKAAGVAGGATGKVTTSAGATSERPTEDVAFYYNRIAFNYAASSDGR
jgi:hypothetical protein